MEEAMNTIKWVNNIVAGDRNSLSYTMWFKSISMIEATAQKSGNTFIESVCQSADKYMRVSDKQAYCLAKFAVENNIQL